MTQTLKNISYFSDFSDGELAELERICFLKNYEKNEQVFLEGESSKYLLMLLKGSVKIYKTTAKANEVCLHTLRPVSFVAELANFENIPYPASARFISSGTLLKIDFEELKNRFLNKPKFTLALLRGMSEKLRFLSDFVHNEMILSAEGKIAKLLIEEPHLFASMKHNQLASFINLAPETFSRILHRFKNDSFIQLNADKSVVILDENCLKELYEV